MPRVVLERDLLLYLTIVDLYWTKRPHSVSRVNRLAGFPT